MLLKIQQTKEISGLGGNWWLNQTVPKIPLGLNRQGEVVWLRYPVLNGNMISDTIGIFGGTGSGKSVMGKNIMYFISIKRPILCFDWKGSDMHLMRYPNSKPINLPPHTLPKGIVGHYLYYPCKGSRAKKPYERVVRPNLAKYNNSQLQALGFSPGAAKYFKYILKTYGPFKTMESLYQFIEHFPYNEAISKRLVKQLKSGKMTLLHNKIYRSGDSINAQSKESIKKILPGLIDKQIFRLDNKEEFNFEKAYLKGEHIIFSFNDKEVGRVEINYYMKLIELLRLKYPAGAKYFLWIEEAHKVLGKSGDNMSEVIEDFVLVCRKLGLGLGVMMPEVIDLGPRVLNDLKNIICGKFKGDNATLLIKTIGQIRARIIPFLRYNRFLGERQMLYYNQDYNFVDVFKPFNSPCEIHRE